MAGIGNFAICRGHTVSDSVWFLLFFIYFKLSLTINTHPLLTHDMLYSKGRDVDMIAEAGRVTWTTGEVGTAGMGRRGFETLMVHSVWVNCGVGSWLDSIEGMGSKGTGVARVERLQFSG